MCPIKKDNTKGITVGENTMMLEAIVDGSCYFWNVNLGKPGLLNNNNGLDKSSMLGTILKRRFDKGLSRFQFMGGSETDAFSCGWHLSRLNFSRQSLRQHGTNPPKEFSANWGSSD